jgi:hypothetical protein
MMAVVSRLFQLSDHIRRHQNNKDLGSALPAYVFLRCRILWSQVAQKENHSQTRLFWAKWHLASIVESELLARFSRSTQMSTAKISLLAFLLLRQVELFLPIHLYKHRITASKPRGTSLLHRDNLPDPWRRHSVLHTTEPRWCHAAAALAAASATRVSPSLMSLVERSPHFHPRTMKGSAQLQTPSGLAARLKNNLSVLILSATNTTRWMDAPDTLGCDILSQCGLKHLKVAAVGTLTTSRPPIQSTQNPHTVLENLEAVAICNKSPTNSSKTVSPTWNARIKSCKPLSSLPSTQA